jgi:hypothetical protein
MESLNTNLKKCAYCNLDFKPHHGSSNYCCSEHRMLNRKKMCKDRYKDNKYLLDGFKSNQIKTHHPTLPPTLIGWQCPLCETIYSPYQSQCHNTHSTTISNIVGDLLK